MFTDGFPDQMGGNEGTMKFMYPHFRETLLSLHKKNIKERITELEKIFQDWKGSTEQLDDVLVINFEIS